MNKIDYYNSWLCKAANMVCLAVCVLALAGCNEDEANSIKEDPYAGGRAPLEVKLLSENHLRSLPARENKLFLRHPVWLNIAIRKKILLILTFISLTRNVR